MPIRIGAVAIVFVAVVAFGVYMFVIKDEVPLLGARPAGRARLSERSSRIGSAKPRTSTPTGPSSPRSSATSAPCCGSCPGKTEVPSLLVDISQTGLGAGLEEQLFEPTGEIQKDFYAELPIKLRYTGSYHELGNFVSGIAALPRIVTLHDITIRPRPNVSPR